MKTEVEAIVQKFKHRHLIILAPHPDDEIIGCYTLVKEWLHPEKEVWFFSDLDRLEKKTALFGKDRNSLLMEMFGISYKKTELGNSLGVAIEESLRRNSTPIFAVPDTFDHHPLHREVTRQFHHYVSPLQDVIYYSVSKNTSGLFLLSEKDVEEKKKLLQIVYPDEEIWSKDEAYVLFESYKRLPGEQWVWITSEFSAYHQWPDAPRAQSFLRDSHRHMFRVRFGVTVGHEDREVEFFDMKDKLEDYLIENFKQRDLGSMSCEMIATHIARRMMDYFSNPRRIEVTVSEDSENGATIRW